MDVMAAWMILTAVLVATFHIIGLSWIEMAVVFIGLATLAILFIIHP